MSLKFKGGLFMWKKNKLLLVFLTVALLFTQMLMLPEPASANTITTYPMPAIYNSSTEFSLKVNGNTVPVVKYTNEYDYAHFSMTPGATTVEVTFLGLSSIGSYTITPVKLNIPSSVSGNKLTFTIQNDEYLIVKVPGIRALVIAADPAEVGAPAASGTGIYNVKSAPYHADSTGTNMATAAIQSAINDAANDAGGQGIVYVPSGIYNVGNLELKSNVALYLQGGAVFRFTGVKSDYTVHWHKDSQNRDITWWIHTQTGANNVKIFGRGTFDGNGKYAVQTHNFASNIIVPMAATNFTFDGPIIRDSGSWAVTPARSNDLIFRNMKMFNRFDMGENDGIDVNESQNVLVEHGIGIGLDDPYTTKAWDETTDIALSWPGSPEPVQNVTFDDLISWTYCYGYKVGQGMRQNQSGITFKNSVVFDAAIGIGVHHKYGSGELTDVTFDNIDIERISFSNDGNRTWALFHVQNADGFGGGPVNGLTVKNIHVRNQGVTAGELKGHSSSAMISDIVFDQIVMPGSTTPATNLHEMNITDRAFHTPVAIYPVQTPEPVEPANMLVNAGFETGNSSGWSHYSNVGSSHTIQWGGTHTGDWKLAFEKNTAYKQKTYQTVSVPNGNYTASVWVRSTGGQNAHHFYAKNYGSQTELQAEIGSASIPNWTQYIIPNIPVTNGQVEIGIWSNANANNWSAYDDFVLSRNYVNNPGFETGNTSGWSEWNDVGGAQEVEWGGTHSGDWKLTHEYATAYKQKTYQTVSVPNGTYQLSVWLRSTGGQNAFHLYAKNYGNGPELNASLDGSAFPSWTLFTIDNIPVTNGQVEIGLWSNATANNWAAADDFILVRK